MTLYCFVKDSAIQSQPSPLPESYGIYCNLALRSSDELLSIGFYPVVDTPPTYDPATQTINQSGMVISTSSVVVTYTAESLPLATVQQNKIAELRAAFNAASIASVTDANGVTWSGGQPSGTAIYLACQMAQQDGMANVTLWDVNNAAHTLTVAEGMTVAATIGAAYQAAFQRWQTQRDAVKSATTISAAAAIAW